MCAECGTILLVEDSPTQALRIAHALETEGYRVRHVRSGAEALAAVKADAPTLIVSDVMMPGMNGHELCRSIKSDPALAQIPLILLTALDTPVDVIEGLQTGVDRYLIKSGDPTPLLTAIRDLLASPPAKPVPEGAPFEVVLGDQRFQIGASREQIVRILLSTYESAVLINHELLAARAALRRQQADLEHAVRKRTRELSAANEGLQEAMRRLEETERMRSEFVSNVSHELRTPLASMSCAISNLLKGVLGAVPETMKPYLNLFAQECERMKGTVASILDMSRIDGHTFVLRFMKVPFESWVRRAAADLRVQAKAKQVTISLPERDTVGFANADPLKLQRVVFNLIKNAIEHSPPGGRVEIALTLAGGTWIEASVTDEGIGIPREHISKLTDRYYRIGDFVSGTGLGLTLCKEILERMGGEIEILSPPPGRTNGTCVRIRMPLASAPTILAVDDSKSVRMLLEQNLRKHGYAVETCGTPEQALQRLSEVKPDLLVVDSVMPGMDGVDVVLRVKADHALRHVPIIMITGAEIAGEKRTILEEFRIPVLGKPWDETELVACVEDAIYGKHYLER